MMHIHVSLHRCGLTFRPVRLIVVLSVVVVLMSLWLLLKPVKLISYIALKCDYAANIEIGKPGIMKQDEEALQELSVRIHQMLVLLKLWVEMLNLPLHKTI